MILRFNRATSLAIPIAATLLLLPHLALSQPIPEIAPEIISSWKHDTEDLIAVFRHDGVFYIVDGDGGDTGQPGMERGTFVWNKTSGAFSANVVVDTNGDAGLSDPNGETSITISGNTLTYNVTEEGDYVFTRIVNTPSAIVGSWHLPGEDANLTFLADGTYYHSEESNDEPDSTTGMERGTYTWNSGTGALSATPITDTNGNIGLSNPAPSYIATISGNVMTLVEGDEIYTLRRITPILAPLNTEIDFEVGKFANYSQTSAAAPALLPVPVPPGDDHPFASEALIKESVTGTGGTLTIASQSPRNFEEDTYLDDEGVPITEWLLESNFLSLNDLNQLSAFPNGANYVFSRTGGTATLSYPADGAFPTAPAIVVGGDNGTWSNGVYALGENQTLIWSAHTAYDPATLATVLSVVDKQSGEELLNESVIQGDIASYDFRGKLTQGRSYDVQLEHVKIAGSTTSGTGPFAGKLGYALYNSNTRFTMVVPEVHYLFITNEKQFRQLSPSQFAEEGAVFDARVEGVGINDMFPASSISVRKPDDTSYALALDEDHWDIETNFPSFAAMRNAFPTGIYIMDIGMDSFPIPFAGAAFTNQPVVSSSVGTWVNGKLRLTATEAATPFTLSTNDSTGNGWHQIIITDASDTDIVHEISNTFENPSLNVVAQISGGMLSVGQSYEMEASFGSTVERIVVSGPSWAGASAKGYEQLSVATYLTIEVVADPSASYTTWQSGFFSPAQLANPSISGDDADFDKDGVPNLLEYLFGGNPTLPSSGLLPAITKAPGNNNVVFTYKRKIAATGVTQVIEHASSLSPPWSPAIHGENGVTIITAAVPGEATSEQVTVIIPSTSTSRFVRLKASRP